jgi:hypothetical protein
MTATFQQLKSLAQTYYSGANKDAVDFDVSSIDAIAKTYPVRVKAINTIIFDTSGGVSVDRYKWLALCVQLCLETPVFSVKHPGAKSKLSIDTVLINELFCFDIMRMQLQKLTGRKLDTAAFNHYKYPLLKLLGFYKEYYEFHQWNLFFTFNFAHLIYLIEKEFFK